MSSVESVFAATGGNAIIYPNQKAQMISGWGYDCKWEWKGTLLSPTYSETVFVDNKFDILRIPIWGDDGHPAHPSDGVVVESEYMSALNAMTNARAANPDVVIFASKKLTGDTSFPNWVKSNTAGPIIPTQYARMVADFLEFMEAKGFYIDILGIDNEWEYNEGDITPQRYKDTIDELRSLSSIRGFNMPLLIAPEMYGLNNANPWMNTLMSSGWGDTVDIGGIHYYPQYRNLSKLQMFAGSAGNRPLWHSEVHWDNGTTTGLIGETEMALRIVFDCFDEGFSGMTWWGYPFSGLKQEVAENLSRSTANSRPVDMDDIDGRDLPLGSLMTRAYLGSNELKIWVVNNSATSYNSYGFELDSGSIVGPVNYIQWNNSASTTGTETATGSDSFEMDLPAYTATLMEFNITVCLLEENALQHDYTNDCKVNIDDLAELVSQWLSAKDITDFASLASEWLMEDMYLDVVAYEDNMSTLAGWTEVSKIGAGETGEDIGGIRVIDGESVKMYSWWAVNDVNPEKMNMFKDTGIVIQADTEYTMTLRASMNSTNTNHRLVVDIQHIDAGGNWSSIIKPEILNPAAGTLGFQEHIYTFNSSTEGVVGNTVGIDLNAGWNNCVIDHLSITAKQ